MCVNIFFLLCFFLFFLSLIIFYFFLALTLYHWSGQSYFVYIYIIITNRYYVCVCVRWLLLHHSMDQLLIWHTWKTQPGVHTNFLFTAPRRSRLPDIIEEFATIFLCKWKVLSVNSFNVDQKNAIRRHVRRFAASKPSSELVQAPF